MRTRRHPRSCTRAFTLLEVVVVLAITALVLGAVYSLAQGTLILADDVSRAERRDTRIQALTGFCEHLFADLPAEAVLNLSVTQAGREYLSRLELENVPSPFDGTPNQTVSLLTRSPPGGGQQLVVTCAPTNNEADAISVVIFEDLNQCEWRVFHPLTRQWTPFWSEGNRGQAPIGTMHPPMVKLMISQAGNDVHEMGFWIAPSTPTMQNIQPLLPNRLERK